MLEQIQSPTEDGRKVQMMTSAATTAFGVFTTFGSGLALSPALALGTALTLIGCGALASTALRTARTA
jgi:hypothetical protein